ncbi:Hcp1 family type VI secretion system effector [Acidobacteria bacterium Mor1]|nr:Hcp1 family type VI secretion system effector [Acidobacteria bacterium Mor1]
MAVDMFLKLEGIDGESRDKAHGKEIELKAWNWSMTQSSAGGAGKVAIRDIVITKLADKASPNLMAMCSNGKTVPKAVLTVRKAGEDPMEYYIITLEKVRISSIATGGAEGSDQLTENVTLAFNKVKVEYQPQKEDGSKDGGAVSYGWDIVANTAA